MKKHNRLYAFAMAGALAVSNLGVVVAPIGNIVAQAAEDNAFTTVKITNTDTSISPGGSTVITTSGAHAAQVLDTKSQYLYFGVTEVGGLSTGLLEKEAVDAAADDLDAALAGVAVGDRAAAIAAVGDYTQITAANAAIINAAAGVTGIADGGEKAAVIAAVTAMGGANDTLTAAKAAADVSASKITIDKNTGALSVDSSVPKAKTFEVTVALIAMNQSPSISATASNKKDSITFTVIGDQKKMYFALCKDGNGVPAATDGELGDTDDAYETEIALAVDPTNPAPGQVGEVVDDVNIGHLLLDTKAPVAAQFDGGEYFVTYTLSDNTNVIFDGNATKKTISDAGNITNLTDSIGVPDLAITAAGKKLTTPTTVQLTVDLKVVTATKDTYTASQKYPVVIKTPNTFTMKGTKTVYSAAGVDKRTETTVKDALSVDGINGEDVVTVTFTSASGVDFSKFGTLDVFATYDDETDARAGGAAATDFVVDNTGWVTNTPGSYGANDATVTLDILAPNTQIDLTQNINFTIVGYIAASNSYFVSKKTLALTVDNDTVDASGGPSELFIDKEIDLTKIKVTYNGKTVDNKYVEWTGDGTVITVDGKSTTATASAVGAGTLSISAVKLDGVNTLHATDIGLPVFNITVSNELTVSLAENTVDVGKTLDLTTATIKNGEDSIQEKYITWKIAGVTADANGVYKNKVASIEGSTLTGIAAGTVEVRGYYGNNAYGAVKVTVVGEEKKEEEKKDDSKKDDSKKDDSSSSSSSSQQTTPTKDEGIKAGETAKDSKTGITYKAEKDGTSVAVTKTKNAKSVSIKKTVKINGKTYKITKIGSKAVTGKKVKNVTIDASNIKKASNININMFKGAKNLTSVKIKGAKKGSAVYKRIVKAAQKVNKNVKIK